MKTLLPLAFALLDFGFTAQVPTGTYDVFVQPGSWAHESGENLLSGSYQALLRLAVP